MSDRILASLLCPELDEMIVSGQYAGVRLGISGWDNRIGGLRPGEVTVVTGHSGSGKTTFAINFAKWCLMRGLGVDYYHFENTDEFMMCKMLEVCMNIHIYDFETKQLMIDPKTLREKFFAFKSDPYYEKLSFINKKSQQERKALSPTGYYDLEKLGELIIEAKSEGSPVVIVDHLHYFVNTTDDSQLQALDRAVRFMTEIVKEQNIHLLLIVHPSKPQMDARGKPVDLGLYSTKGSSSIPQESSNYIVMKRLTMFKDLDGRFPKEGRNIMIADIKKNRAFGDNGYFLLDVQPNRATYLDAEPWLYEEYIEFKKRGK